ncbi:MAG: hypothetical protein ACRCYU_17795 [Nocardioides sp.]
MTQNEPNDLKASSENHALPSSTPADDSNDTKKNDSQTGKSIDSVHERELRTNHIRQNTYPSYKERYWPDLAELGDKVNRIFAHAAVVVPVFVAFTMQVSGIPSSRLVACSCFLYTVLLCTYGREWIYNSPVTTLPPNSRWRHVPEILALASGGVLLTPGDSVGSSLLALALCLAAIGFDIEIAYHSRPRRPMAWIVSSTVLTSTSFLPIIYNAEEKLAEARQADKNISVPMPIVAEYGILEENEDSPIASILDIAQLGKGEQSEAARLIETSALVPLLMLGGDNLQRYIYVSRAVPPKNDGMVVLLGQGKPLPTGSNADLTLGLAFEGTSITNDGYLCVRDWTGAGALLSTQQPTSDPAYREVVGLAALLFRIVNSNVENPVTPDQIGYWLEVMRQQSTYRILTARGKGTPGVGATLICGVALPSGFRAVVVAVSPDKTESQNMASNTTWALRQIVAHYRPAQLEEFLNSTE